MEHEERAILAALHSIKGIGNRTLWTLVDFFGSFTACWTAKPEQLYSSTLSAEIVQSILDFRKQLDPVQYLNKILSQGINIVSWQDSEYPLTMRNISNPPYVFYSQGRMEYITNKPCIGIVGSRQASNYGKTVARRLAMELAGYGITVVSGMARGIDSEAHRGALENGATVAVLGNGLNIIYPPENKHLLEQIIASGLVISEFPLNTGPEPKNFPMRNRIISGLCRGIVVVEAARKSGALITADFALEQGRDVFAVPGSINSQKSEGTNNLIKQGAKLVSCIEDIIEEYPDLMASHAQTCISQGELELHDEQEINIINLMGCEEHHFDELLQLSGMNVGQLSTLLLRLELQGIIRSLAGNYYIRV
jgi:DNA processing protein